MERPVPDATAHRTDPAVRQYGRCIPGDVVLRGGYALTELLPELPPRGVRRRRDLRCWLLLFMLQKQHSLTK